MTKKTYMINHILIKLVATLAWVHDQSKEVRRLRAKRKLGVKAKRSQGCGPRRSSGVVSHIPGSVRKCEGV